MAGSRPTLVARRPVVASNGGSGGGLYSCTHSFCSSWCKAVSLRRMYWCTLRSPQLASASKRRPVSDQRPRGEGPFSYHPFSLPVSTSQTYLSSHLMISRHRWSSILRLVFTLSHAVGFLGQGGRVDGMLWDILGGWVRPKQGCWLPNYKLRIWPPIEGVH